VAMGDIESVDGHGGFSQSQLLLQWSLTRIPHEGAGGIVDGHVALHRLLWIPNSAWFVDAVAFKLIFTRQSVIGNLGAFLGILRIIIVE
jgi:hypothetical protein